MNKHEQELIKGTTQLPANQGVVAHIPNNVDLYLWSDQHFGAMDCNYKLAENITKEIKNNPKARVIFGGDTIEAIPRGYKISERGQHCTPDVQVARTVKALRPIRKKIVVMFAGNHNTMARGESMDSDMLIAASLDVPYKTVPTVVQLISKKGTVRLAGGHGKSGAKNGDIELEKLRNIFPGCNGYFLGHNHMLYAKHTGALSYDSEGVETWEDAYFIRTGNCLNYADYARYSMYAPQRSGCVKLAIRNGKIKEAVTVTDDDF